MNEKVSGCKYSLMIANAFLNFKVFEFFFFFSLCSCVCKFPILRCSLCLRGVSGGVAENKIKVILYDVYYFIQLLHLPKEKSRNNITYCVWLLNFVEFLIFEYISNEKCISYSLKNYLSFSFGNLNKDTDELYLVLWQPTAEHIFPP